jgi:hypothetical protein
LLFLFLFFSDLDFRLVRNTARAAVLSHTYCVVFRSCCLVVFAMKCPLRTRSSILVTLVLAGFFYGRLVATKPTLEAIAGKELDLLDLRPTGWTHAGALDFFHDLKPLGRAEYGHVRPIRVPCPVIGVTAVFACT